MPYNTRGGIAALNLYRHIITAFTVPKNKFLTIFVFSHKS